MTIAKWCRGGRSWRRRLAAWLIAALLAGGSAGHAAEPLSAPEIYGLQVQIWQCWKPPNSSGPVVRVRVVFRPDGSLAGVPEILNHRDQEVFEVFAAAAIRALRLCQPYEMPRRKYQTWKEIIINFDPDGPPPSEEEPV